MTLLYIYAFERANLRVEQRKRRTTYVLRILQVADFLVARTGNLAHTSTSPNNTCFSAHPLFQVSRTSDKKVLARMLPAIAIQGRRIVKSGGKNTYCIRIPNPRGTGSGAIGTGSTREAAGLLHRRIRPWFGSGRLLSSPVNCWSKL